MILYGMTTTSASAEYTRYALQTFFEHTLLTSKDRFILIDNDNDFDETGLDARIELIRNAEPKGFGENANQAVDIARLEKRDLIYMNNDLIFSPGWSEPLTTEVKGVLSPLSNREVPYDLEIMKTPMQMGLDQYIGKEAQFNELARIHAASIDGYMKVFVVPFFCVKLPLDVMNAVGHFDTDFGRGGAEDYDYCLRAWLAGFDVSYAKQSFILHFGGKSSWSGVETTEEQEERELKFKGYFGIKWGEELLRAILLEDRSIFPEGSERVKAIEAGRQRDVIIELIGDKQIEIFI